jgi:hypothetical protein
VDLVLGLSLTSADVQWVLVEGTTAEGATIRRDAVDFDTLDDVVAAVGENRLHAVGITWANEAESAASTLLDALAERGIDNVITVSDEEAADALAMGIADRGGYTEVAVCIVDPDNALVALVDADGVTTERVDPDDTLALLDRSGAQPEAIFVLGSAPSMVPRCRSSRRPRPTWHWPGEPRWRRRRRSTPWKHSPPGGACRRESVR